MTAQPDTDPAGWDETCLTCGGTGRRTPLPWSPQREQDANRGLTGAEAARKVGCSYRQLDYWTTTGLTPPTTAAKGSGTQRRYTGDALANLDAVARLIRFGLTLQRVRALSPDARLRIVDLLEREGYL